MSETTERLRQVADQAADGPWEQDAPMMSQRDRRYVGMLPRGDGYRAVVAAPDDSTAEHIATFDPVLVAAMLDVIAWSEWQEREPCRYVEEGQADCLDIGVEPEERCIRCGTVMALARFREVAGE